VLSTVFEGQQLVSERDFVREYWASLLPPGRDVDALLPPPGEPLDATTAFERCQAAAMDDVVPRWALMSDAQRGALEKHIPSALAARDAARARGAYVPSGADLALGCIDRLCAAALSALLRAGVQPGAVDTRCGATLLQAAMHVLETPYPQSPAARPHALATLRALLAHAQPRDWLTTLDLPPLQLAVSITQPEVSLAVLDELVASPGGFPAHAVAASPGILHHALQKSTPAFVEALLAAGADAVAPSQARAAKPGVLSLPLHALATANPRGDPRDFRDKLRLLLDAGADLEATGPAGKTALAIAVGNQRPAAFDVLLAAGAQPRALLCTMDDPDAARAPTVLHFLAEHDDAALIPRVLATRVLDVDARAGATLGHFTPLHVAAASDAPRSVSALLAAGASLAATTAGDMTALQLAIDRSCAKAARPLVEATPPADRPRYAREAAHVIACCARRTAARPSDAAAVAELAAARAVAALLA
jgi:hypothetical protein